jgi:ribosomal protein S19E (S16A)
MRMGVQSPRHRRAAGKVIRYCLKQLSDMGLVGIVTVEGENENGTSSSSIGRKLTKKGMTDMDRIASQVNKEKNKAK